MKKNKTIAFWCEHAFAIYSAKPIIEKYKKEHCSIILFTEKRYITISQSYLELDPKNIFQIENFKSRLGSLITNYFKLVFVKLSFSELYHERQKLKFSKKEIFISRITRFLKVDNKNVNSFYNNFILFFYKIGLLKKIPIHFDLLYSFTKINNPYLLAPFSKMNFSIMESWDHPAKEPYLLNPYISFTWNKDLKNETIHYQNIKKVRAIFALKFRYIKERTHLNEAELLGSIKSKELLDDLSILKKGKIILYPMSTASNWKGYKGEIEFVRELAAAAEKEGLILYLRPYPLAPKTDCLELKESKNIYLGYSSATTDGTEVLNEELQSHKYILIKKSNLVVNVGTTFVFDSALIGSDILQVSVNGKKYGDFATFTKGLHIKNYLLNEYSKSYNGDIDQLSNLIKDTDYKFKDSMVRWLEK